MKAKKKLTKQQQKNFEYIRNNYERLVRSLNRAKQQHIFWAEEYNFYLKELEWFREQHGIKNTRSER